MQNNSSRMAGLIPTDCLFQFSSCKIRKTSLGGIMKKNRWKAKELQSSCNGYHASRWAGEDYPRNTKLCLFGRKYHKDQEKTFKTGHQAHKCRFTSEVKSTSAHSQLYSSVMAIFCDILSTTPVLPFSWAVPGLAHWIFGSPWTRSTPTLPMHIWGHDQGTR